MSVRFGLAGVFYVLAMVVVLGAGAIFFPLSFIRGDGGTYRHGPFAIFAILMIASLAPFGVGYLIQRVRFLAPLFLILWAVAFAVIGGLLLLNAGPG